MLYPIGMTVGKRIKSARGRLDPKLSQAALGEALGISDKAVSAWERDEGIPEATRFPAIAKALRVPLLWLITGEGPGPDEFDLIAGVEALSSADQKAVAAFIEHLQGRRRFRA